jgi:hypothetical protein
MPVNFRIGLDFVSTLTNGLFSNKKYQKNYEAYLRFFSISFSSNVMTIQFNPCDFEWRYYLVLWPFYDVF